MMSKKVPRIVWTERSIKQARDIQNYLTIKFSEKEVADFYNLLTDFEKAVSGFPKLFPKFLIKKKLRRAVLNKNLSVYYYVKAKR